MHREPPALDTGATAPLWQVPAVDRHRAWLGGVAAAIAREVGLPVGWVRAAFVLLALIGGWGIVLYVLLWALLTLAEVEGLTGTHPPTAKGSNVVWRGVGFGLIVSGLLVLFSALPGLQTSVVIGLCVIGFGAALIRRSLNPEVESSAPSRPMTRTVLLLVGGFGMIALGTTLAVAVEFGTGPTTMVITLAVVLAFAVLAATSPWWWGLLRRVDAERQARIRADERAAVGAQLHDSVLQTLALIQNQTDPALSAQLARRQERELRNWLQPDRLSRQGSSLQGQIDALAVDIERLYAIRVETVVVGDVLLTPEVEAVVAAAREAVVNAAKHSGASEVDLFAEVTQRSVDLFVRDRGVGFDVDTPTSGIGIRESIRGRMGRVGGDALISSAPGEGTEVELRLPRDGGI